MSLFCKGAEIPDEFNNLCILKHLVVLNQFIAVQNHHHLFMKKLSVLIAFAFIFLFQLYTSAQFNPYWTTVHNGQGDFTDRYTCIRIDPLGNTVVAGSTVNFGQNRDFLVSKFDVNGTLLWRISYNAIGNGADEVAGMAIDNAGNIHVTGLAKGDSTSSDYLTLKLDPQGTVLWAKLYDSPYHLYDQAVAINVDATGNVIVTGQGDRDISPVSNDDIFTVKYDASGNKLWEAGFNGFGNATDRPVRVVTDANNDIYICGRSDNGVDDDMILIKYSAAGAQSYIRYGDRGGNDRGADMVIDGSGNVFIVGRSDNGANDDYYLQKYSSAGVLAWEVVYDFVDDDRPAAMTLSPSGQLVVTGQSDQDPNALRNWDICTVAFSSTGLVSWSQRFNGAANNDEAATSIITNPAGDIYVTGSTDADPGITVNNDVITLAYSSSGTSLWSGIFSGIALRDDIGSGIAVNLSGNCMVAGSVQNAQSQFDALLLAYNNSGSQLFNDIFSAQGDNSDNVREIAVNSQGETYIAGYSTGKLDDRNFLVMKLLANGDTAWVRTINGTAPESSDEANDLILDAAGNVIVAGWLVNSGTSSDVFVVKYNPLGDTLWTYRYNNAANESDKVYDVELDANGDIYLTGRTDINPTIQSNDEILTIKLSSAGVLQWLTLYSGVTGNDRGIQLQKDPSGNGVYVTGRSGNGTDYDISFLRYSTTGALLWSLFYNSGRGNDEPVTSLVDGSGNFYVCGTVPGVSDTLSDIVLIKITPAGSQAWVQTFNGNADESDLPESMIFNAAGEIVIAGQSDQDASVNQNNDILLLSYSASGNLMMNQHYDRLNQANDVSDDIAIDAAGHYLILGRSDIAVSPDVDDQVFLMALDGSGTVLATDIFGGNADTSDAGRNIVVQGNDLFISGSYWNTGSQRDLFVRRCSNTVGIQDNNGTEQALNLYPNPAENEIFVSSSHVIENYTIINMLGQPVLSGPVSANRRIPIQVLADGVYLLQLTGTTMKPISSQFVVSR